MKYPGKSPLKDIQSLKYSSHLYFSCFQPLPGDPISLLTSPHPEEGGEQLREAWANKFSEFSCTVLFSLTMSPSLRVCSRMVLPPSPSFSSVYSCTFSRLLALLPRLMSLHIVSCFLSFLLAELPAVLEKWLALLSRHTTFPVLQPLLISSLCLARVRHPPFSYTRTGMRDREGTRDVAGKPLVQR